MKSFVIAMLMLCSVSGLEAQVIQRDVPYASPASERQILDIYSPENAKDLPVMFWIHGGGWQVGDKSDVALKPQVFMDRGFVFVSTNYRLLPHVDMGTLIRDVAKSLGWVHQHIAEQGGDPNRIFVGGHSAGAQLAAPVGVALRRESAPARCAVQRRRRLARGMQGLCQARQRPGPARPPGIGGRPAGQ